MAKKGLMTKDEAKFYGDLISGVIEIKNPILRKMVQWAIPIMLDAIDNRVGDKLPEPWQSHAEQLTTKMYEVMQDKVITPEEEAELIEMTTNLINENVDVPLLDEDEEAMAFMFLLKFIASLLRKFLKGKND